MSGAHPADRVPDPLDVFVGQRIKQRRGQLGVRQADLATLIGCSTQQLQKYEAARDRISASRLVRIASALRTTVGALVGEALFASPPEGAADLLAAYAAMSDDARQTMLETAGRLAAEAE